MEIVFEQVVQVLLELLGRDAADPGGVIVDVLVPDNHAMVVGRRGHRDKSQYAKNENKKTERHGQLRVAGYYGCRSYAKGRVGAPYSLLNAGFARGLSNTRMVARDPIARTGRRTRATCISRVQPD